MQVHDLVLDFAVAQHAEGDLCRHHRKVVAAFRGARPEDAFGRRKFDKGVVDDAVCKYVCNEVMQHITEASHDGVGDECLVGWLQDTPQDVIVAGAGKEKIYRLSFKTSHLCKLLRVHCLVHLVHGLLQVAL